MKNPKQEIIKLFRTGKFTIVTHDRGSYSIYSGRYYDYEDLPEEPAYHVQDDGIDSEGYMPAIVAYLTEALGGTTDSI